MSVAQSVFSAYNSCKSNFGDKDTGHVKPMGSKIRLAVESIILFVIMSGEFIFKTSGFITSVSLLLSHKIPKTSVRILFEQSPELSYPRKSKPPVAITVFAS